MVTGGETVATTTSSVVTEVVATSPSSDVGEHGPHRHNLNAVPVHLPPPRRHADVRVRVHVHVPHRLRVCARVVRHPVFRRHRRGILRLS